MLAGDHFLGVAKTRIIAPLWGLIENEKLALDALKSKLSKKEIDLIAKKTGKNIF